MNEHWAALCRRRAPGGNLRDAARHQLGPIAKRISLSTLRINECTLWQMKHERHLRTLSLLGIYFATRIRLCKRRVSTTCTCADPADYKIGRASCRERL